MLPVHCSRHPTPFCERPALFAMSPVKLARSLWSYHTYVQLRSLGKVTPSIAASICLPLHQKKAFRTSVWSVPRCVILEHYCVVKFDQS